MSRAFSRETCLFAVMCIICWYRLVCFSLGFLENRPLTYSVQRLQCKPLVVKSTASLPVSSSSKRSHFCSCCSRRMQKALLSSKRKNGLKQVISPAPLVSINQTEPYVVLHFVLWPNPTVHKNMLLLQGVTLAESSFNPGRGNPSHSLHVFLHVWQCPALVPFPWTRFVPAPVTSLEHCILVPPPPTCPI